jgi:hypothetical protein
MRIDYGKDQNRLSVRPLPGVVKNPNALYEKVASIRAKGVEDVFSAMNNPYFTMKLGLRSMCVGDCVLDPYGNWWKCEGSGWTKIDHPKMFVGGTSIIPVKFG